MKEDPLKRNKEGRKNTRRTRQIDKSGEERDLEWEAPPAKGKLPPSPTRRVEPACLLAIIMIPESSTYSIYKEQVSPNLNYRKGII